MPPRVIARKRRRDRSADGITTVSIAPRCSRTCSLPESSGSIRLPITWLICCIAISGGFKDVITVLVSTYETFARRDRDDSTRLHARSPYRCTNLLQPMHVSSSNHPSGPTSVRQRDPMSPQYPWAARSWCWVSQSLFLPHSSNREAPVGSVSARDTPWRLADDNQRNASTRSTATPAPCAYILPRRACER